MADWWLGGLGGLEDKEMPSWDADGVAVLVRWQKR